MKTLRCTFEMEIDVQFENPEASEAYFIRGDWKETFYDLDDLEQVAEHLADGFHHESDSWDTEAKAHYRMVEGFGYFYDQKDGTYKTDEKTAGWIGGAYISIRYECKLTTAGTCEV